MSRNKLKFGLISLLFLIFWVGLVYAQNATEGQVQAIQRKTILDFKEELKLTKEQEEKIGKIIADFEQKVRALNERAVRVDREIGGLLEKGGELKELEKKVKELFSLRADAVIEEIKAGRAIDKLLNEEQRRKWKEIRRGGVSKGKN